MSEIEQRTKYTIEIWVDEEGKEWTEEERSAFRHRALDAAMAGTNPDIMATGTATFKVVDHDPDLFDDEP
jgi:hypothetical protein